MASMLEQMQVRMEERIKEICALEEKYGYGVVSISLGDIMENGRQLYRNDKAVAEALAFITQQENDWKAGADARRKKQDEEIEKNGFANVELPPYVITPELQRELVRCSVELARYSVSDLTHYIQHHYKGIR